MIKNFKLAIVILLSIAVFSCAKNPLPEIEAFKPAEFIEEQKPVIEETSKFGPKNNFNINENSRRIYIDENVVTDYTKIVTKNFSETFPISINFDNVDIRSVMQTFSIITGKNILVGDEVQGVVKARIFNENWDNVLEAILEIKNIALTLNPKTNIVRVHSKEVLTSQEQYKRKRKAEVRLSMELSKSIEPVRSEIFKLYYSSPAQVKGQIEEILANMDATVSAGEGSGEASTGSSDRVKMTVDNRLRALIVLGGAEDLNFIEKLINQIDVPTKQILVEAYVVTVKDTFTKALGTRLATLFQGRGPDNTLVTMGGTQGSETEDMAADMTSSFTDVGTITSTAFAAAGGLGLVIDSRDFDLQMEIEALETSGVVKTISNPKIFTLNNQIASIKQGVQLPYTSTGSDGTTSVAFKDAALNFSVTPSIVGDGNIILDIALNADEKGTDTVDGNFSVDTVQIQTKLLVADKSIVIIGGVYKNSENDSKMQTPGFGELPIIGNLFKRRTDTDEYNRIYMFVAPKIL
jgi:type IV pilus assembly protein PilQ